MDIPSTAIHLRSGGWFDLLSPSAVAIDFCDIAGSLSKLCRFNGQCETFYSVAEHSHVCASVADADRLPVAAIRAIVLHDAAEAFCGDITRPLKSALTCYANIYEQIESLISRRFNVDFARWAEEIAYIDDVVLSHEQKCLFSNYRPLPGTRVLNVKIHGWQPQAAEMQFTALAQRYGIISDWPYRPAA